MVLIEPHDICKINFKTNSHEKIIRSCNNYGIFHLGSNDLVHHDEFIGDIINTLGDYNPVYKHVYTTNDERYLAVLPKENKLPKHLQINSNEILVELEV